MPVGAAIGAIGGVANGVLGFMGSKSASKAQQQGQANALAAQNHWFSQIQGNLAPYMDAGKGAVMSLAQLYGLQTPGNPGGQPFGPEAMEAWKQSPDFLFAQKQGMEGLEFSNAAKGLLKSRGHLNQSIAFNSGLATQNFGNYRNSLMDISRIGAGAAGTFANAAGMAGNSIANTMMAGGNAQAAGIMGGYNALAGGVNSVTNALTQYNAYSKSAFPGGSNYASNTYQGNPHTPGGIGDPLAWGNLPGASYG